MKTKYLFGALMAVMATSCTAKTNEPAAPQSGKTMPDQSLLSAIRTNSGNSPCPVPSRGILCSLFHSVHLETQFFLLPPVSPVKGTETGLTGGGKRQNTKWRSKVNAMQKNRKGFAPFPENS